MIRFNKTGQQISKKNFVSVMNMLLMYLFTFMKLEKGHKKLLVSNFNVPPCIFQFNNW